MDCDFRLKIVNRTTERSSELTPKTHDEV